MPSMTRASDDKPDDLRTVRWAAENLDGLRLHDRVPPGGWDFAQVYWALYRLGAELRFTGPVSPDSA
jgi:hypothetical protein